jgi:Fe-S-cluster-containing hydrogenase component 2
MATMITSDCINCGACEPECPNNAISQSEQIYVIDPLLCTECVGFHDYEACAAVCPVDCCVTDPNNIEDEQTLIGRARAIHSDVQFAETFESRFRKNQDKQPAEPLAPKPAAAAATETKASAPVGETAPASSGVKASPSIAAASSKTEPTNLKPPVPEISKPPRVVKKFPGELTPGFADILQRVGKAKAVSRGLGAAVMLLQPILGALSEHKKRELEIAIGNPILFSRAGATALNVLVNLFLYPLVFMVLAIGLNGIDVLFSQKINGFILLGVFLAFVEAAYRFSDGIFKAKQPAEMVFPGAVYGITVIPLAEFVIARQGALLRRHPIPVDGFYGSGFVEKLERERRYGNVYSLQDWGESYYLQVEFPRKVPPMGPPINEKLPQEMPDYDYDLFLKNGTFIVKGKCTDEKIRRVSSSLGAFPPEFTTIVNLKEKVSGFSHRYDNKVLEVVLLKEKASLQQS